MCELKLILGTFIELPYAEKMEIPVNFDHMEYELINFFIFNKSNKNALFGVSRSRK